jgi:hypothetical protein
MADITLTITIPDAKVAKAREVFFVIHPKPESYAGTDKDWIEETIRHHLTMTVKQGLLRKAQADAVLEDSYTVEP